MPALEGSRTHCRQSVMGLGHLLLLVQNHEKLLPGQPVEADDVANTAARNKHLSDKCPDLGKESVNLICDDAN